MKLPLSLHRQFILMEELDQQARGYNSYILPTSRKYISLRRSMASRHGPHFSETPPPQTPTPMSISPECAKSPQTTREMLSHIGWLSEELWRASEEKVNLAQATYDSVGNDVFCIRAG